MGFEREFYQKLVADWRDYYINLEYLNAALGRMETLVESFVSQRDAAEKNAAGEMDLQDLRYLDELRNDFQAVFEEEIVKFSGFFKLSFRQNLRPKLVQLHLNFKAWEQLEAGEEQHSFYFQLKKALQIFYRELTLFRAYFDQNTRCVDFLSRRYRSVMSRLDYYDPFFVSRAFASLNRSFPLTHKPELDRMLRTVENIYTELCGSEEEDSAEVLRSAGYELRGSKSVVTGVFIGIFLLACCIVVFLLYEVDFFSRKSSKFVSFSFPIFRGTLLMNLYIVLMGLAVYVWQRYNINYQRPLGILDRPSTAFEIFKLGFGFLCLWIFVFIYCGFAALNEKSRSLHVFFHPTLANWLPPGLYLCFFLFLLFPSRRRLYGPLRMYLFDILGALCLFPFTQFSARDGFAAHQIVSFKSFFRDLAYTVCYADNLFRTGRQNNTCTKHPLYRHIEQFVSFFPFVIAFSQIVRRLVSTPPGRERVRTFIGLCKTTFTLVTLVVYELFKDDPPRRIYSSLCSAINTVNGYTWDVYKNWQLLQGEGSHPLLRRKRAFPSPAFYYSAMVANLFMRSFWALSILPLAIFADKFLKNLFGLLSLLVEIARRTIWNVIKVEVLHLKSTGNFNAVQGFTVPLHGGLEEVRALPDFEQEYQEALYQQQFREFDAQSADGQRLSPYENLNYSFTEAELRSFATRRTLQLSTKGERQEKQLSSQLPYFGRPTPHAPSTLRKQAHFHRQKWNAAGAESQDDSLVEEDVYKTPLYAASPRLPPA